MLAKKGSAKAPAWRAEALVSLVLCTAAVSFATEPAGLSPHGTPLELIRQVVRTETQAISKGNNRISFRSVKTTRKGSSTKLYVETREATAGEVVAYNGQPLSPEQRHAEEGRIERFINKPEELKKKCAEDRETTERTLRILRALPDAFRFDYAGEQAGSESIGRLGTRLLKFNFHPNPVYQPPSRLEEVLTGLRGVILIDAEHYRLASIDATLFKDVAFGWGILGHLNRGGRFII